MVEEHAAEEMDDENGILVFKLCARRDRDRGVITVTHSAATSTVVATLTFGDMKRNAEAVADHKSCWSRHKVDAWPEVHDTFAITVVAGRGIFRPDPLAAIERTRKMRKQKVKA
jgi:hypothetical protein